MNCGETVHFGGIPMNTVSLLLSDRAIIEQTPPCPSLPVRDNLTDTIDGVEVRVPLDIYHFLRRASTLIKDERVDITRTSAWNNSSVTIAQASIAAPLQLSSIPSSLWEILGDIKKVSYRLGWLDGHSNLRKKFIENLKQQYTKKEGEYNEQLMKLSHLLNWKSTQIARMTDENEKLQHISDFLFEKSESLEVSLAEAKKKIFELAEFLEKSKARETKLAQMLTRARAECDELKDYLEESKQRETKLAQMLVEKRSRAGEESW